MERVRIEEAIPVSEKETSQLIAQFLQSRPEPDDMKENGDFNSQEIGDVTSVSLPASTYVQISSIQAAIEGQTLAKTVKIHEKQKSSKSKDKSRDSSKKKKKKRKSSEVTDIKKKKKKKKQKEKEKEKGSKVSGA